MIIKRLATGIKNQDWFVVIVEVMIVVVGIFIGLQVDDWNEGLQKQAEIDLKLERIKQDALSLRGRMLENVENTNLFLKNLQTVQQVLNGTPLDDNNRQQFIVGLDISYKLFEIDPTLPGLVSLMQSSDINRIQDETVREALIDHFYRSQSTITVFAHLRTLLDLGSETILRYISYDIEGSEKFGVSLTYRLEAMQNDPEAVAAIGNAANFMISANTQTNRYIRLLDGIITALEQREASK